MARVLQPILCPDDPEQEGLWVDATPFRAHLHHLLGTGLTEPLIAGLTGLSVRAVEHLAHGRRGRRVRRIPGDTARRLLGVTTLDARAIRFRPVSVRASRTRLRAMAAAGWSEQRMAADIGLGIRDVQDVLGGDSATCSELTALKIAVAYENWEAEREFPGLHAAVA